jgi:hypothetical protein
VTTQSIARKLAAVMFLNAENGAIRKIVHATVALALVATPLLSSAQQERRPGGPGGDIPKFLELGPKVGDQMPDVTIVDDMGMPVNVRELTKGNYSVLVLGCLT